MLRQGAEQNVHSHQPYQILQPSKVSLGRQLNNLASAKKRSEPRHDFLINKSLQAGPIQIYKYINILKMYSGERKRKWPRGFLQHQHTFFERPKSEKCVPYVSRAHATGYIWHNVAKDNYTIGYANPQYIRYNLLLTPHRYRH